MGGDLVSDLINESVSSDCLLCRYRVVQYTVHCTLYTVHCTVLCSIVMYSTVLYSIVMYSTVLYSIVMYTPRKINRAGPFFFFFFSFYFMFFYIDLKHQLFQSWLKIIFEN